MPNKELIFTIKNEIDRCKAEIRKVDDTIIRMQERRLCYDHQKTAFEILLDIAKKEGTDSAE